MQSTTAFPTGNTVPFPYERPYPQQVALMDTLLQSLRTLFHEKANHEDNKGPRSSCPIFMLESPTGTGKSLSLACAALSWLRYTEQNEFRIIATDDSTPGTSTATKTEPSTTKGLDWLDDWTPPSERERQAQQQQALHSAQKARTQLEHALQNIRKGNPKRELQIREATRKARADKNNPKTKRSHVERKDSTEPSMVLEYHSDPDATNNEDDWDCSDPTGNSTHNKRTLSPAASLLYGPSLDGSGVTKDFAIAGVQPGSGIRKIVYAARTHSQLSQFVQELKRTAWGSDLKIVALGGRKILCGNTAVNGKSEALLTEACLDLQKGTNSTIQNGNKRKSQESGCPLLSSRDSVDTLALHTLSQPTDIEEAAQLGKSASTCGYYANRVALPAAEVVVVPYNLLLSASARKAVGLSLHQALVLVDEAHNLPEALRGLHSQQLSLAVIQEALQQLAWYVERYSHQLAGRNIKYLGDLRKILGATERHLLGKNKKTAQDDKMRTCSELLFDWKVANINLFKLLRYMERTRLSQKLLGWNTQRNNNKQEDMNESSSNGLSKHVSAMSVVQGFLEKLALSSDAGKFVTDWNKVQPFDGAEVQPTLRYVLLKPSCFFQDLIGEAHAVALVGGTLRPFVHIASEVLGPDHPSILRQAQMADVEMEAKSNDRSYSIISNDFSAFTCDHVVPQCNVLLQYWETGPTGKCLDFRHANRSSNAVIDELGECLKGVAAEIPHGMVIFIGSYRYEDQLVRRWRSTGVWSELERMKSLYREPKGRQNVESTLLSYAKDAKSTQGAILFSVIGGKLSEGINFSNDMARCVIVVGLPYPDLMDPVLKEKMAMMDACRSTVDGDQVVAVSGQSYYQNLCLRAVNQSVGRAIRHAGDYAAILLLDIRFQRDKCIQNGLPGWLRRSAGSNVKSRSVVEQLVEIQGFFKSKGH